LASSHGRLGERLIRFADTVRLEDGSDVVVEF